MLLTGFDLLVQRLVIADESADEAQCREKIAGTHQHAGDNQFLDRIGVGAGGVEDDDALVAHRLDRNVVGPGAGAADTKDAGRDRDVVHGLRAHENGVGSGDVVGHRVAFGQAGQSLLGNRIERLNLAGHGFFLEQVDS